VPLLRCVSAIFTLWFGLGFLFYYYCGGGDVAMVIDYCCITSCGRCVVIGVLTTTLNALRRTGISKISRKKSMKSSVRQILVERGERWLGLGAGWWWFPAISISAVSFVSLASRFLPTTWSLDLHVEFCGLLGVGWSFSRQNFE
jgi:hypothetical protein